MKPGVTAFQRQISCKIIDMEAIRETTVWDALFQPNHTYLMNGSKAVAYIKEGTTEPFYFSKPMMLDKRRRTFSSARMELFKVKPKSNLIQVAGSKGNTYFIDPDEKTCSCLGFQFRSQCKHIDQVATKISA